ncbi:MAG TPA: alpha/beta hydrolase, partial [Burkholderiales bacterium]|nr:alpha/beta hydrolase [Burkholderiales bacterium]
MTDFVDAGGHRLEYERLVPQTESRAASPVLVLLHEGLGSVALWKDFPRQLANTTGCPVIVYSRHGYGRSGRLTAPREVGYMHREALEVLPEVLSKLGIVEPVLVGHSDGASIALIHAARHPVRGLVAMAPHVFVEDITVASIARAKTAFETTNLAMKLGRYQDDVESTFRGWNDIWLHPAFHDWNIEEYLPDIDRPVLLIQGEDDQYGTIAQTEAIARQVSAPVETILLPDCAHSPHVDQTAATLGAIVAFVRRLAPAPE